MWKYYAIEYPYMFNKEWVAGTLLILVVDPNSSWWHLSFELFCCTRLHALLSTHYAPQTTLTKFKHSATLDDGSSQGQCGAQQGAQIEPLKNLFEWQEEIRADQRKEKTIKMENKGRVKVKEKQLTKQCCNWWIGKWKVAAPSFETFYKDWK